MSFRPPPAADALVHMRFVESNPNPWIEARGETSTLFNFFYGEDPAAWRTGVRAYREIIYHDLWPGVDLVCRESHGRLTCETVALSRAHAQAARFAYEGADPGGDPPVVRV